MTWLSVQQVADLLGIGVCAVQIFKDIYEYRHVSGLGRGGKQLQIVLESLHDKAQAQYHGECEEKNLNVLRSLTDAQRDIVFEKIAAVEAYKDFKTMYPLADKLQAFLDQYNEEHPESKPLTKRQLNVSVKTASLPFGEAGGFDAYDTVMVLRWYDTATRPALICGVGRCSQDVSRIRMIIQFPVPLRAN